MNKDNMNISKIETFLDGILNNKVSENTFFGSYPERSDMKPSWEDMVFVEIPNGISDMEAYGTGTVLVWLFAKPLPSGRKNVAKLSEMESKLNLVIDTGGSHDYRISKRETYTEYDSELKWHANIVEIVLKIF